MENKCPLGYKFGIEYLEYEEYEECEVSLSEECLKICIKKDDKDVSI